MRSESNLSDLEHDALTELVNLGVSRAAANLSEMVGEQVHLSVPSVSMMGRSQAIEILNKSEASKLIAVHQVFDGEVSGRALVIFPEAKSLELVRAVTSAELKSGRHYRTRTRGACGNWQYHPELLPGDHRQPAGVHAYDIVARRDPWGRLFAVQLASDGAGRGCRHVHLYQLCSASGRHSGLYRNVDGCVVADGSEAPVGQVYRTSHRRTVTQCPHLKIYGRRCSTLSIAGLSSWTASSA